MKCSNCDTEMIRGHSYKDRGRHSKQAYHCLSCGNLFIKRSLIRNKVSKIAKAKGCTVPWGKSKTHKKSWER